MKQLLMKTMLVVVAMTFLLILMIFNSTLYVSKRNDANVEQNISCYSRDVDVFGQLTSARRYVVLSTTSLRTPESIGFMFLLPLTVMAWKRIGFDSVVIIVGSADVWNSDSLYYHVFHSLRKFDAVVIFVKADPPKSIMISQVSRIFVGSILRQHQMSVIKSIDDVYLVTSHVNLWPISASLYDAPVDKDVLSLKASCSNSFIFNDTYSYHTLPCWNIGMSIRTWVQLTNGENSPVCSDLDIEDLTKKALGEETNLSLSELKNYGDSRFEQKLISAVLRRHAKKRDDERTILLQRQNITHRIDDRRQTDGNTEVLFIPLDAYKPFVWSNVVAIIQALYNNRSHTVWSMTYQSKFWQLLD